MASTIGKSFTVTYDGLSRVLNANVGISIHNDALDPSTSLKWKSLWDTGATCTVITENVISSLGLKPVSVGTARTPQGQYNAYMYLIDLFLPNRVVFPKLLVMAGKPSQCDILIGMDVIGSGDFAVSNFNRRTVFSYRFPSSAAIDFVEHSYQYPVEKRASPDSPAKNSPCPCGSGKKYKQCCGKGKF